ncbi:hypothetical protein [Kribbella sp. CA-293567]|uniref:hypothetical protein n=1 Tax=Kribbella sp. CA-293567 TaxID=3002436 RepID=UPI0022DE8D9C|nr:hypothetical protein [Kribbella sp. CA-293567]WBQ06252.1 hypothetical protein OX958_05490 [Kribbella sp. CA-293567]
MDTRTLQDCTRPLMLGYLCRGLLVTDGQMKELEQQMATFAQAEGFAMGFVYVERSETSPAAFGALMESVNRYEVSAIVVPSRLHLAVLGSPLEMNDRFERAAGVRVLLLES